MLSVLSYSCREVATLLRMSWEERIIEKWAVCIRKEIMPDSIAEPNNKNQGLVHSEVAEEMRKTIASLPADWSQLCVEDATLMPPIGCRPVLFEQRYMPRPLPSQTPSKSSAQGFADADKKLPLAPKEYAGVHMFVLVHGFQGNSYDMRLMKNNIALLYPEAICLCSSSNEDNTEGDVTEMGIRLAQEVVNYISDWCPGSALGRLSFIAHSIS